MPNVAELIKDHVTLIHSLRSGSSASRIPLNTDVPRLQNSGGVIGFLLERGAQVPSPAVFGQITAAFKTGLQTWSATTGIPWLEFKKGERKDTVVQRYRDRFTASDGVMLVGVAQERANPPRARTQVQDDHIHFDYARTSVYVNP